MPGLVHGRLLVTTSTLPLTREGSEPRFVWDLAFHLQPHFDEVHVLAPGHPAAPAREDWNGVRIHRFTYAWPRAWQTLCYGAGIPQNLRRRPWLWTQAPVFTVLQAAAVRRICRAHGITVVNSHWLVFQGLAAAAVRRGSPFRHVTHIHAAELYALLRLPRRVGGGVGRFIARRCDDVVCESTYVRERLDELLGAPSHARISCMGVNARTFGSAANAAPRAANILFVGRLVEKKGVEYLLRAMPEVRRRLPAATLRVVGGGPLEPPLKALAGELGLLAGPAPAVDFLGPLPHASVVRLLETTDVCTIPSIVDSRGETEGMPTVILEAMAAGKRVVASRVNGTPDVVADGENGWLCRPADPADLADKLAAALTSDDARIPERALATAARYDWPVLAERYAAFLKGVP